jgi:hypothetical protein
LDVDRGGAAFETAERAERRHLPFLPEKRTAETARAAAADDLAALVDRDRLARDERATERPQIANHPLPLHRRRRTRCASHRRQHGECDNNQQ